MLATSDRVNNIEQPILISAFDDEDMTSPRVPSPRPNSKKRRIWRYINCNVGRKRGVPDKNGVLRKRLSGQDNECCDGERKAHDECPDAVSDTSPPFLAQYTVRLVQLISLDCQACYSPSCEVWLAWPLVPTCTRESGLLHTRFLNESRPGVAAWRETGLSIVVQPFLICDVTGFGLSCRDRKFD